MRQNHQPARLNPSPITLAIPSIYSPLVLSIRIYPLYLPLAPSPCLSCPLPPMHETRRLVEAASALSAFLQTRGVPHAFHGDILISLLANQPLASVRLFVAEHRTFLTVCFPQQISCIVQGGTPHPFRLVRDALRSAEDFSITPSPWSDRFECSSVLPLPLSSSSTPLCRLHVKYHRFIPPIEVGLVVPIPRTHAFTLCFVEMRSRSSPLAKRARAVLTQTLL